MHELINLTIILFSSLVAIQLSSRIGIPAVVGQLLVGIFIGPALLNWVKSDDIVSFLSEIGVILLMFLAGLEANLSLLKNTLSQVY